MTTSPVASRLEQLKADAVMIRERITKEMDPASFPDVAALATFLKNEITQNIVPMFESSVDAVLEDLGTEIDDLQDRFDEFVAETGDQLSLETAQQILTVFQQGLVVCAAFQQVLKTAGDVQRKRGLDAIKQFRAVELAVRPVIEAIVVMDDEEPEDAGGEPSDPGDEVPGEAPEGEPAVDESAGAEGG